MNFAIVDIETTGGSPKSSKITEIAIYKHDGEKIIDEYVSLVNPEIPIPPFIVRLTGISDEMVKNSPKFYEIAKDIVKFTDDCVFVAHNVAFDYSILRYEFKSLGFDYRKPHLCTVRASRYVLPGHDSYSLGKLSKSLGIEIKGRHRAGGDAFATAQLFTLLMQTDPRNLETFIQKEINPKKLHPNLDIEDLEAIPNKTGVYKFYNELNQLIYIGKSIHIKKRIEQHLRNNSSAKGIRLQQEIARIEFELTGSELIALLWESNLIKKYQPIFNRSLKRAFFPYGLFDYFDDKGYHRFYITQTSKRQENPVMTFSTRREGVSFMERMVEEYELCMKLCDLYATQSACFNHSIKACRGACVGEESVEEYNARCNDLIDNLSLSDTCFYVVGKGRERNEKSLVYIENGGIRGIGYAPFHFNRLSSKKWQQFLTLYPEDRDARSILKLFLRKHPDTEIVRITD